MATNQSATAQDITDELIAGMPEGYAEMMDLADPDGPGPLFTALGSVLATVAIDRVDDLRDQLSPLSCNSDTLAQWEASLTLDFTRIARAGSPAERRAQVIARLREWGAPTLELIRRVVYSYLGYASPADVVICESDRDALRTLHTYRWTGARTFGPASVAWTVLDGGTVAPGGVAADLCLSAVDLADVTLTLTGPDAQAVSKTLVGRGAVTAMREWSLTTGTAAHLLAVFAVAADDVWFCGASGTILHYDGSTISAVTSGVAADLNAVHGTSASNVWFVGAAGTILRWDGSTISSVSSGVVFGLLGVWAVNSSHAWAVGASGTVLFWDGATWTAQTSGTANTLRGVWAADSITIWACGDSGTIVHSSNGSTWGAQTAGVSTTLNAIRGTSPWDVWACGASGVVLSYDVAGAWSALDSGVSTALRAIAPDGTLQEAVAWPYSVGVWLAGAGGALMMRGTDATFGTAPTGVATQLNGLWAQTAGDVWGVGNSGLILHMLDAGTGRVRVYFPELEGAQVDGAWSLAITSTGGGTIYQADLFAEGAGLDTGGASGRGTAAAWWGVMFEPAKSSGTYDLDAARLAVARLTMASRWSNILRRSEGAGALAAGSFGAIPGDSGALPGAAVPGA